MGNDDIHLGVKGRLTQIAKSIAAQVTSINQHNVDIKPTDPLIYVIPLSARSREHPSPHFCPIYATFHLSLHWLAGLVGALLPGGQSERVGQSKEPTKVPTMDLKMVVGGCL